MAPDQERRLEEIFSAARELPEPERAAFLEQACGGHAEMRRQADSLLVAHGQAGQFLQPTVALSLPNAPVEKHGDRIGRYKLLEQIGEGGFGVVWMAEQEEPVRRRVALKIIKLGMDTKEVVARFEAERQALAMMDHPNIARVFDGGATGTGRPYFVMELVKGVPITEYCDANILSTEERLELFMQVCHAVQHAHQKGVIHRDLKPSNILVTVQDAKPVPKVIDFGVAKATEARLTEKTLFTRFQQWIGTPAYMSPEQAGLGSLDVDTRSDIYSLGVLLYELLTGRTPFDTQKLLAAGYDAVMRTIREDDPPKPSTRLSTFSKQELSAVASKRRAEPANLSRLVRGDLDWIVMKALEKDRTRRYETASHLAMEIERHLNVEPVLARPPNNYYRFHKWIRRHKSGVIVATSVSICLLMVAFVLFELIDAYYWPPARMRGYRLNVLFDNVHNLKVLDRVRISGVPVGVVEGISLDPTNGKVRVQLKIFQSVAVKTDTLATIEQDPLARRNFVQLKVGSFYAERAPAESYLMTGEEAAPSNENAVHEERRGRNAEEQ